MWGREAYRDVLCLLGLQDVPLQNSAVADEAWGSAEDWEAQRKQEQRQQKRQGGTFWKKGGLGVRQGGVGAAGLQRLVCSARLLCLLVSADPDLAIA